METSRLTIGTVTLSFPTLREAVDAIARRELTGAVHLCNAYTLSLADERSAVAEALTSSAANLPDGTPIVWWARSHGVPAAERVYGPDLMEGVLDTGRQTGIRHYLYGSTPEVLEALTRAIGRRWPGAEVVGSESPPFRELTRDEVEASVRRSAELSADVVWVGMGTPKQDFLVTQMARFHGATFVAIGAAFDFIAGTKRQAPRWVMRAGLEWLYRLVTEPRRLWRRYLVYNAKFIRLLWRHRDRR